MLLTDRLYGPCEIHDPVLIDLINSPSLQRLNKIAQLGIPDRYYHVKGFSRFDHSVGVMLLLRMMGASLEEQVAGLLHDVSHTAFSHTTDWLNGDSTTEDGQDLRHASMITHSELPAILEKHGYETNRIVDHHLFSLLEQDAPALCADRVDYALREFSSEIVPPCLNDLQAHNGRLVFSSIVAAQTFANAYLERQRNHWGAGEAVSRYRLAGRLLKEGVDAQLISREDFMTTDAEVLAKLEVSDNPIIQRIFSHLRQPSLDYLPHTERSQKKFRHVDPHVLVNSTAIPLSHLDSAYAQALEAEKTQHLLGTLAISIDTALATPAPLE